MSTYVDVSEMTQGVEGMLKVWVEWRRALRLNAKVAKRSAKKRKGNRFAYLCEFSASLAVDRTMNLAGALLCGFRLQKIDPCRSLGDIDTRHYLKSGEIDYFNSAGF